MTLERHGIPTVAILTHSFAEYGRRLTKMQKMPQLPLVAVRHPVAAQPEAQVRGDVSSHYNEIVRSLLRE
jgi:hypothetical protein